jgi:hypothetical protein
VSDEELVKRLRGWAKDIQEGSTAIYAMDLDLKNAASSIEALNVKLAQATWLLTEAAVQLEEGKIKTRRNRAAIIWNLLDEMKDHEDAP